MNREKLKGSVKSKSIHPLQDFETFMKINWIKTNSIINKFATGEINNIAFCNKILTDF